MFLLLRQLVIKLFILITLSLSLLISQISHALEGGVPVNASDYPGLVMLSYDDIPNTFNFQNCTGIVLEPRRILTSASCVYALGTNPTGYIPIPATNIHVHPASNGVVGPFTTFNLPPSTTPNIGVSSYAVHPDNPFSGGHHNLGERFITLHLNTI